MTLEEKVLKGAVERIKYNLELMLKEYFIEKNESEARRFLVNATEMAHDLKSLMDGYYCVEDLEADYADWA